ncbi:MAG: SDR family oxidoreductase [Chlamydiota bacterium]
MTILKGKTVVITGASRGIGQAIALRYAGLQANIVILTKDMPQQLEDITLQIQEAGGSSLVLDVDVCDQGAISQAVALSVERFGGIDVLVNNTSATCFTDALHTTPGQFDLVICTSARAAFFLAQACVPYLKNAENPHIINISPPLDMDSHWFENHLAFSLGKYAMSMCTLGMARAFQNLGIAVNSLWPRSTIATQTIKDHFSSEVFAGSRWPSIMADAAFALILRKSHECTGQFFTDEALLRETGIVDFSHYAVDPSVPLMQALFIPKEDIMTPVSQDLFLLNQPKG